MITVYTTAAGARYHQAPDCKALEAMQLINEEQGGMWVPGAPYAVCHPIVSVPVEQAAELGKTPCASCKPPLAPVVETFGHEPAALRVVIHENWTWHSACQSCRAGSTELVCVRCMEFDANGMWRIPAHPVHWPCTSAVVLGLVDRTAVSA